MTKAPANNAVDLTERLFQARRENHVVLSKLLNSYAELDTDLRDELPYRAERGDEASRVWLVDEDDLVVAEIDRVNEQWRVNWIASVDAYRQIKRMSALIEELLATQR